VVRAMTVRARDAAAAAEERILRVDGAGFCRWPQPGTWTCIPRLDCQDALAALSIDGTPTLDR